MLYDFDIAHVYFIGVDKSKFISMRCCAMPSVSSFRKNRIIKRSSHMRALLKYLYNKICSHRYILCGVFLCIFFAPIYDLL